MPTNIRPEISKKNKWWISKHRYYELKHFCLQYPEWKEQVRNAAIFGKTGEVVRTDRQWSDPTATSSYICEEAMDRIRLVEECCSLACGDLSSYILRAVTEGLSYVNLKMMYEIPCSRDTYYELYRRFYYVLSSRKNYNPYDRR